MKSKAVIYLALLGMIWGASFLFIKISIESIPLFTFIAGRMALGAFTLYLVLRLRGEHMPPLGRAWVPFLVIGALNAFVPYSLIAWGEQHISSGLAAILNGAMPIFTVLLAHSFIPDEHLSLGRAVGIVTGFIGVVIVTLPDLRQGLTFNLLGQLAVVLAALSYALASVYTRRALRHTSPIKTSIGMLISGFVFTLPLILILEKPLATHPTPAAWLSWVTLGVMGTAVAYILYYWLIGNAGATYTSLVTFILPPIGVFWGALILRETVAWEHLLGLIVIVTGILAVNGYLDRPLRRLKASLRPT